MSFRAPKTNLAAWCLALFLLMPAAAQAWWNADWSQRLKVTFNTSATGVELKEPLSTVVIPLRLHSGNFQFTDAKADGSDLRVVAADDKVPLKYQFEKFDGVNDLAIVWVQVPRLAAGSNSDSLWLYYGNQKAARGDEQTGLFDPNETLVLHFSDAGGNPKDATAYANTAAGELPAGTGVLGASAVLSGTASLVLTPSPSLALTAAGGFSFSAWLKSTGRQSRALIFSQVDGPRSILIGVDGDQIFAQLNPGRGPSIETPRTAALSAGGWHHVAVTLKDRLVAYIDGQPVASVAAAMPDMGGRPAIGAAGGRPGFAGEIDELHLSNVARSEGWVRLAAGAEQGESKLAAYGEAEGGESVSSSYFGILLSAVTPDGWVVIGILMVMALISVAIMIGKAIVVSRTDRANRAFLQRFEDNPDALLGLDVAGAEAGRTASSAEKFDAAVRHSSLYRIYHAGVRETRHRFDLYEKRGAPRNLTPQAIQSIRASLDTGMIRETNRLNSKMVLLTIAISGGPFLGLLGTVVGVMITFAAIAAAGDVNVNSIAPGIAAALVATVAGLGVAIPALFGYNYLASRIKTITTDMQVFADELLTKLAEAYSS
jgi:biopolymer transport protein ExbB